MAKRQQQELTELAKDRITRVVRSLAEDRVDRGVDLARPMHCSSCNLEKPSAGSSSYGEYSLCNDCLLDFTMALASGTVDGVVDFMTKRTDESGAQPPELPSRRERQAVVKPKLMPRNEPIG